MDSPGARFLVRWPLVLALSNQLTEVSQSAYIFAQVLGGIIGAGLVYGNYINAIDIFEKGTGIRTRATASLFATYAVSSNIFLDKKKP